MARAEEHALAALGESRFRAELEAGRRLTREAAVGLALGRTAPRAPATDTASAGREVLARRQADVARLVAEGLSNRQIGARLFIGVDRVVERA